MRSEMAPNAHSAASLRALRASISPLVLLLSAIIALLLLLLSQSTPTVDRAVQSAPQPQRSVAQRHESSTTTLTHTRADWKYAEQAEVCKPIFDKLARSGFLCGLYQRDGSCHKPDDWREYTAKGVWMFSQFMQDAYLYIKHFSRLNRRGVYLDIASNHPIKISNTYFFDRCLGWTGMCVEANEKYFEQTYRERSCQLVPTCVGATPDEKVQFRLHGEIGGVVGDSYKFNNDTKGIVTEKRCTTAQAVLDRNRMQHVDLLSLDVEGYELQVLKGIDFSRTRIDVILIEKTPCFDDATKLLEGLGYERIIVREESAKSRFGAGFIGLDAIFVRGDVQFGFPA